jgi:hypothetical protein
MYSSEYTSGFSGPAASHLAAPPSPHHEDNVGQAPANFEAITKNFSKPAKQATGTSIALWIGRRPTGENQYRSGSSGLFG